VREPSDSAARAAEVFERADVPWALVGALAALRYRATPRITVDADFLARYDPRIVDAFRADGYEVTEVAEPGEPPHLLVVRGHGDVIDVLLAVVEYQEVALARAVDHVLSIEDVLIHKLIAWRPRDRNDIASILETDPDLDHVYLDEWVTAWEVEERWQEARAAR
jgi:hypothetical protein